MLSILVNITDKNLQQSISFALEAYGLRVIIANTDQEALNLAALIPFALALLDMPFIDRCCQNLNLKDQCPEMPIIYLIASDDLANLPESFINSSTDFICKPVLISELLIRIKLRLAVQQTFQENSATLPRQSIIKKRVMDKFKLRLQQLEQSNNTLRAACITTELALDDYTKRFDFGPTAYFSLGVDSKIYQCNFRAAQLLGRERTKLIGLPLSRYISAQDKAEFQTVLFKVFSTPHKQSCELNLQARDQNYRVKLEASIADSQRKTCLVNITDITDYKRLQNQLIQQTQELKALFEFAPDPIIRYDNQQTISYVNPQLQKILNKPQADLLGKQTHELFSTQPRALRDYLQVLSHVINSKQPAEFLLAIENPIQAEFCCYNIRFAPEYADNQQLVGVIAIGRDYSQQRQLELALIRREREFRTLVENSPDEFVRYDNQCRRIYVNYAFLVNKKCRADEILGKTPQESWFIDYPDAESFSHSLQEVITTGNMKAIQAEQHSLSGKNQILAMYLVPEFAADGKVHSVLAIGRDISELKAVERDLQVSRAKLRALSAQREETREQERKHIAREMHDELGQCLTALRMAIGRLRLEFGGNNPELCQQVKELLSTLDNTIQWVRNVATALRPAALDLGIIYALEWLANDFQQRTLISCHFNTTLQSDLNLNNQDATAIFRIVQESLTNVAKHAQAKQVIISLQQLDQEYLLIIQDDGIGFETEARNKGNCLGLIGIEERVLLLGGEINIETSVNQGVKLSVKFSV